MRSKFSIHQHKELDGKGNVLCNTIQINCGSEYTLWRPHESGSSVIVEHADIASTDDNEYRWNSYLVATLSWGGADNVTEYIPLHSLKWHVCDNNNDEFFKTILDDSWHGSFSDEEEKGNK